jgi:hypothetical protein
MIRSYDRPVRLRLSKLSLGIGLIALLALPSGCGHTRAVGSDRTLHLGLTEYRLNPQSARISAGTVTILIHNYGRLTHNLVVSQNGTSIASTRGIPPGSSAQLDLSLAAGDYLMTSTILADQALGEYGTLTVS